MKLIDSISRIATTAFLGTMFLSWAILLLSTLESAGAMLEAMIR